MAGLRSSLAQESRWHDTLEGGEGTYRDGVEIHIGALPVDHHVDRARRHELQVGRVIIEVQPKVVNLQHGGAEAVRSAVQGHSAKARQRPFGLQDLMP